MLFKKLLSPKEKMLKSLFTLFSQWNVLRLQIHSHIFVYNNLFPRRASYIKSFLLNSNEISHQLGDWLMNGINAKNQTFFHQFNSLLLLFFFKSGKTKGKKGKHTKNIVSQSVLNCISNFFFISMFLFRSLLIFLLFFFSFKIICSRLNSSGAWRHSMKRDLGTDIDSVFSSRTGATLPKGEYFDISFN